MSRLATLPVSLPRSLAAANKPPNTLADDFIKGFDRLTDDFLVKDATWRDSYALTGTLRTFYGATAVSRAWADCKRLSQASNFKVAPVPATEVHLPGGIYWVEVGYVFETENSYATALLSVVPDPEGHGWKIWVLRTILEQIKEGPRVDVYTPLPPDPDRSHDGPERPFTTLNGGPFRFGESNIDCLIVGAGQAGLDTAARCKALGISYALIDKEPNLGDNWRNRYESARLHTVREYAQLPYDRTFDDSYPEYLGKDDLARGFRAYAEKMNINVSLSSKLLSGRWDEVSHKWTLNIEVQGSLRRVVANFVILAVGAGGQTPSLPKLPGRVRIHLV